MVNTPESSPSVDALVAVLYEDLRRLARRARWHVSAGATLQTTALVHEAYLKLRNAQGFADRQHFLHSAAQAMRHILINMARDAVAMKRGAGAPSLSLDDAPEIAVEGAAVLIEVDRRLDKLRGVSARLAQVVECRFFAGFSDAETAEALGMNERTVRRDWLKARAWLRREMDDLAAPADGDGARA